MNILQIATEWISHLLPLVATVACVAVVLWGAHRLLIRPHSNAGKERLFSRQLVMLGLSIAGIVAVTLSLPVSQESRNQLISIIGLVVSGIFAFSSSTIFSNMMAGVMLRITTPFRTGDFVTVEEHAGRVVECGLLDTEIQTESRTLVAIPNTYLISRPISVVRSSGAIITTSLSLGYDTHHARIESRLMEAARQSGLEEAFVQIQELGDYSVTYKVCGLLKDVKSLLTAQSKLCRSVLDVLHEDGIEIMSPIYMNQRPVPSDQQVIPPRQLPDAPQTNTPADQQTVAEDVVFDKAEQAEQKELAKKQLSDQIEQLETALEEASAEAKEPLQQQLTDCRKRLENLEAPVEKKPSPRPRRE